MITIPSYLFIFTTTTVLTFLLLNPASHSNTQTFDVWQQFNSWKVKHNRQYEQHVEVFRFETWKSNLNAIEVHNARADQGLESYHMGLNQFADLTEA